MIKYLSYCIHLAVYRDTEEGQQVAFATWLDRDQIAAAIRRWARTGSPSPDG